MKILLWDLETSPMVVTTWGLRKPYLTHDNIIKEPTIICGAWKWFGQKEVYSAQINPKYPRNDKPVVQKIYKALESADVLVAHNGDKFDLKKFNARAIYHELAPLPNILTIDTLKVARKLFSFSSNRLDYLGKFLCNTGKIHVDYDLWIDIMEGGDEEALEKMVTYNRKDVLILEKVYERLRPFIKNHPNANLFNGSRKGCPTCGSTNIVKKGFSFQLTTKRQAYKCKDCGRRFCGKFISRAELK